MCIYLVIDIALTFAQLLPLPWAWTPISTMVWEIMQVCISVALGWVFGGTQFNHYLENERHMQRSDVSQPLLPSEMTLGWLDDDMDTADGDADKLGGVRPRPPPPQPPALVSALPVGRTTNQAALQRARSQRPSAAHSHRREQVTQSALSCRLTAPGSSEPVMGVRVDARPPVHDRTVTAQPNSSEQRAITPGDDAIFAQTRTVAAGCYEMTICSREDSPSCDSPATCARCARRAEMPPLPPSPPSPASASRIMLFACAAHGSNPCGAMAHAKGSGSAEDGRGQKVRCADTEKVDDGSHVADRFEKVWGAPQSAVHAWVRKSSSELSILKVLLLAGFLGRRR